ncbi:MAG: sensor histidine kinase [Chitinophagales bacterium]
MNNFHLYLDVAAFIALIFALFLFYKQKKVQSGDAARLQQELNLLQSQINPHFLFNTLNSIYALALKKSDSAPQAVLKLSSLMRYTITDARQQLVAVETEVKQLQAYIDLQRLRLNANTEVKFEVSGVTHQMIAPVLLLPFVENAFKYGAAAVEQTTIAITLKMEPDGLHFTCWNRIFDNPEVRKESSGLGIENVKRRLELLYAGKYHLDIRQIPSDFFVELKINL